MKRVAKLANYAAVVLVAAVGQPCVAQRPDTIAMQKLPELTVRDRYTADSIARRLTYSKTFHDAEIRTRVYLGIGGIIFDQLFSDIAMTVSGKKRKVRAFRRQFLLDETERAAWRVYSVGLVMAATGLDSADAWRFRLAHPMPKDAYEGASYLELLQWVRNAARAEEVPAVIH